MAQSELSLENKVIFYNNNDNFKLPTFILQEPKSPLLQLTDAANKQPSQQETNYQDYFDIVSENKIIDSLKF